MARRHVEIAGAGFAGLTAAIAFARRGWTVRVHEQATAPREFGAGIFLWNNGLAVLRELAQQDRVLERCYEAPRWELRDAGGRMLSTVANPGPDGTRLVTVTRSNLHSALLAAAHDAGVSIRTDSTVTAATGDGTLLTEGGRAWPADLVIGADGIRSRVRAALNIAVVHTVLPFVVSRFLVPRSAAPAQDGPWGNYVDFRDGHHNRRVLFVPCNRDDLYLLLGAHREDVEALERPLRAHVWQSSFPFLRPVLTRLPATPRTDNYEAIQLDAWSSGRVALVGDAAHAMPPTIGQGAGTAMMNALTLATTLDGQHDLDTALAAWEATERPPTEQAQRISLRRAEDLIDRAAVPPADEPENEVSGPAYRQLNI